MENLVYKPDIYEGKDPYIFASFHQNDRERVLNILEKMDLRGFRFWISDGITPGMESDEIIAEHIEGCDFFLGFLSGSYLESLDTVDELNYSRDVDKKYLLIYLEDVPLPYGLDMRFMRAESIKGYNMTDENIYAQLLNMENARHFYGIADESLRERAENVFNKLEKYYPEHKVFSLNAVGKQISKEIAELSLMAGYPTTERLMLDYGFVHISAEEARSIRSTVIYQPGEEPDIIKGRLDYILQTLEKDYPGKCINDNFSTTHKSIYKSLVGLSLWLGYESIVDMLEAYGYTGLVKDSAGRAVINHKIVLEELRKRYEGKKKPRSISQLIYQNPDLAGNIKTITNRSWELFGMTLYQYFRMEGFLEISEKEENTTKSAENRIQIIEEIKKLYESSEITYGTYEDVSDCISQIVLKKNKKGQIYVSSCESCNDTMRIPYGVEYISKEAFSGQSDLETLILPPTVKEIRESAFSDCDGLTAIVFAEGLDRIGNSVFSGCSSLKKVEFPKSLKAIGNEAFSGCVELEDVTFKNLRINIQEDAFTDCIYVLEELQDEGASPAEYFDLKVDRKNNAKIIAYTGDEEVVVIPGMISGHPIVSIEKGSFKGNQSIKEVYISDHITGVNGDAFKECKNLTKVHLSESVTKLTATAFAGCVNLSEINIPDAMVEVQRGIFKDSPLTTLYIGKGTQKISSDAFYKGEADFATGFYFKKKSLENLIIDTGNETFSADGTTLLSRDGKVLVAELGDPVHATIPEGVEEISASAYEKLSSLCEVSFPSTLKKIGEKAFAGTNLKAVELPKSLEVIEMQAFSYCRSLSELDVNEGLRVIGQQAFEGCPITDVYIPASVESIGNDSFLAISTYQGEIKQRFRVDTANVNIIADGIALYQKAEEGMTLLKAYHPDLRLKPNEEGPDAISYSIMEGTEVIAAHSFARCNNLQSIVIPDGVKSIGDMAFWDCQKIAEIHIPESCTEISPKAFFGITVNMI